MPMGHDGRPAMAARARPAPARRLPRVRHVSGNLPNAPASGSPAAPNVAACVGDGGAARVRAEVLLLDRGAAIFSAAWEHGNRAARMRRVAHGPGRQAAPALDRTSGAGRRRAIRVRTETRASDMALWST